MVRSSWKLILGGLLVFSLLSTAGTEAMASPMTIQATEGNVRSLLMGAARMGGLDLVMDDAVGGTVSLSITAEPEEIIEHIAAAKGLVVLKEQGVYLVTLPGRGSRRIYVYTLHHADPKEIVEMAKMSLSETGEKQSAANDKSKGRGENSHKDPGNEIPKHDSEDMRLMADPSTNSLVLYGTPAEASALEDMLERLDVPAKQVSLEAKIVAISKDASRDLGVEWSWQSHRQPLDRSWRQRWEQESYVKDPGSSTIRYGIGPGVLGYNVYFDAKVDALVTSGKAKLLSRPNITTLQGREAVIEIGGEVPVPEQTTANDITTYTVKYRKAGIILRYTPRVNENGDIMATVHTEVSSPLYVEDIKAYRFQTRSADTHVRLKDGETMVIGGLIGSEEAQRLSKVPFLGDLPVLGHFFRHTSRSHTESELLIFLTARILDDEKMILEADSERIEEQLNGNKNPDRR